MMSPDTNVAFHILHVSDLHLTSHDGDLRSEPKVLGRLIGMNERFRKLVRSRLLQRAHCILVTGDVTDRGDLEAWHLFWDNINQAGLMDRTWVIPGNHDVCCLGVRSPGKRRGYKKADLNKALQALRLSKNHPDILPWVCRPDHRVAIFGLNSNNLGNWNVAENAIGSIGYFQLAKLARLLRDSHEDVKIVALHHSPNIPGKHVEVKRGLKRTSHLARMGHQVDPAQRQALRLLCITQGVRLIVHGHLHRAEDRRIDGVRIVGVPASTEPRRCVPYAGYCELATYTLHGPKHQVYVNWKYVKV